MELIERIETADEDEQEELLWDLFYLIKGDKPPRAIGGSKELTDYLTIKNKFNAFMSVKAYFQAALFLMPKYVEWGFDSHYRIATIYEYLNDPQHGPDMVQYVSEANTTAMAIAGAICRYHMESPE